jgi:ribonuclease PH
MVERGLTATSPVRKRVAAVSVGVVDGEPRLDLDYDEDVRAGVDMNVVLSDDGRIVEVQGTAEHGTFSRAELDGLMDLAVSGIAELDAAQRRALASTLAPPPR